MVSEISNNLTRYRSENKILLNPQNNYVEHSNRQCCKKFDILAISLGVLHNYFGDLTKLFSNLYLVKCLHISAKLFFFFYGKLLNCHRNITNICMIYYDLFQIIL